jgi:hypothetical protein
VSVLPGSRIAITSADLTAEIFRNDVIMIGDRVFRVDSRTAAMSEPRLGVRNTGTTPLAGTDKWPDDVPAHAVASSFDVDAAEEKDDDDEDESEESSSGVDAPVTHSASEDTASGPKTGVKRRRSRIGTDDSVSADRVSSSTYAGTGTTAKVKREAKATARLTLQRAGIGCVSVANDVTRFGGHFSVADTAPHMLRSSSAGYAVAFTPTQLPLDRPWDGLRALEGVAAYRFGATADVRVLWREVGTGTVVREMVSAAAATSAVASAGHAAAFSAGGGSSAAAQGLQTSTAGVDAVLTALGGVVAFRDKPPFPLNQQALYNVLEKAGLGALGPTVPGSSGSANSGTGPKDRQGKKPRRLSKKAFIMQSNQHVKGTAIETALKIARIEVLKAQQQQKRG